MTSIAPRHARAAVAVLAFTIAVILFGAVVRITGSGAGCGQHWPTCHGEVAHLPERLETVIELTHRVTSGLDFLAVVALALTARWLPRAHGARRASLSALGFMWIEVLVGAALVLLGTVGDDASPLRAVIMPIHLVNTSLLLAALLRVCLEHGAPARRSESAPPWVRRGATLALAAILLVSVTGAITALGDTVAPPRPDDSLLEHLRQDHAVDASWLARLRVVHPALALLAGVGLGAFAMRVGELGGRLGALGRALAGLVGAQLAFGMVNLALGAPGWAQVVHLALANALWLSAVWVAWEAARTEPHPATVAVSGALVP